MDGEVRLAVANHTAAPVDLIWLGDDARDDAGGAYRERVLVVNIRARVVDCNRLDCLQRECSRLRVSAVRTLVT